MPGDVDNGRRDTDLAVPAVEHHVNGVTELEATWSAVVGLIEPNRFAEGAPTPPPNADNNAGATGWSGTRTATVSTPPVASTDTRRPLR